MGSKDFLSGYKTYDVTKEGYGSQFDWKKQFYKRMSKDEALLIMKEDDPYSILGVTIHSTRAEIKKAFYKLAMKWHPDKNPNIIEKATIMMQKINAAYSILI